ncbi:hypothetical protein A4H02_09115 [Fervidobacterium thailandense]|uniref:DUF3298 domain-containing protein n=2 Tax=Fervidobacterium thailandense TaxID=1008305 RepID=A0A1E3G258_9BACT|nr:hypothetical protein A4H02_09115 [Fervidobacterium thailandense]
MQMGRTQAIGWLFLLCVLAMFFIARTQKIELVEIRTQDQHLEICVTFPLFKNLPDAEFEQALNTWIEGFVRSVVNKAREEAIYNAKFFQNAQFELRISTEVHELSKSVVSIALHVYKFTGGAHGTNDLKTFTVDLSSARLLTMSDLFNLSQEELENKLRSLILERISKNKADFFPWVEEYVETDEILARPFVATERGVKIFYQEGEIAPRSNGITHFEFSWDELEMSRQNVNGGSAKFGGE